MSKEAPAYTWVRDRMRDDIFSGALEPGIKLPVALLAKRYGVSSMPIRAALQELRGEGLIVGEPRKAATVRLLNDEFVENLFDLRIAVLGLLFKRCVRYMTNADIEEIEAVQARLEEATARKDYDEVRRLNHLFHQSIHRVANNPEAASVIERNWILIDALRAKFGFDEALVTRINSNHRRMIEALRNRDAEAAFAIQKESSALARDELIGRLWRAQAS